MSADTVTFDFDIPGLARPVVITAEFEAPDAGCGQSGGWFLSVASIRIANVTDVFAQPRFWLLSRADFGLVFGSEMLRAVEEFASEVAQDRRYEDQDRSEEIA